MLVEKNEFIVLLKPVFDEIVFNDPDEVPVQHAVKEEIENFLNSIPNAIDADPSIEIR